MVRAYSVPEILKQSGWDTLDLLKIDIEGSERELFAEGCQEWLGRVRVIFVELHEGKAPGCGRALFRALSDRDYQVGVWGEHLVISIHAGKGDDVILPL